MKKKFSDKDRPNQSADNEANSQLPGYPIYPADEDLFNTSELVRLPDPKDKAALTIWDDDEPLDFSIEKDAPYAIEEGSGLDVPGAELDDEQESIGSEDEENNYYSLGGDAHLDLEEDKSE